MLAAKFAKAAAQAEKLRVEALARRQAKRCVYGGIGVAFGLAAFALAHVADELALAPIFGALEVTVLMIALDLVAELRIWIFVAEFFVLFLRRKPPERPSLKETHLI